jgi:hypothetical protein
MFVSQDAAFTPALATHGLEDLTTRNCLLRNYACPVPETNMRKFHKRREELLRESIKLHEAWRPAE